LAAAGGLAAAEATAGRKVPADLQAARDKLSLSMKDGFSVSFRKRVGT
jgi:hypothetical protein